METEHNDHEKQSYSLSEISIVGFALSLIVFAAYLNFSTTSLRHFFFKTLDDQLLSTPIGKVVSRTGYASRERATDVEFKTIGNNATLYPNDTLMTGHDSSMIVELKNGQRFEMGSDSLIKLAFDFDFSFSGLIERNIAKFGTGVIEKVKPTTAIMRPTVELEKKEKAPPPPPPPLPLVLSDLKPSLKTEFSYTPEEFLGNNKPISLSFRLNRPEEGLSIDLFSQELKQEVFSITPQMTGLTATALIELHPQMHPAGDYIWEVHNSNGKLLASNSFNINPIVPLIKTLPTEGSTTRLEGLATQKNFTGFTLRWEPIEGISKYNVKIFDAKTEKQVLSKELSKTALILNRNKIVEEKMYYQVQRKLMNQFIAISHKEPLGFELLAPELTTPPISAVITPEILKSNADLILFTWTKSNYTDYYEIEISQDPSFQESKVIKRVKDNLFSYRPSSPGKYYWRVRAYYAIAGKTSPYSEIRPLTITP